MDLSCECECDCEAWAEFVGYELVSSAYGLDEHLVERLYCDRCRPMGCKANLSPTHTNPWRNT